MTENRIIAFTGTYGCLIMANTSTGYSFPIFWTVLATLWAIRYIYLEIKR